MFDARIGRLLVASLHQGISDTAPGRLELYEHWLSPVAQHEGRTGLAALNAALSFLRREAPQDADRMMRRAGEAAAEWTYLELSPMRRRTASWLPSAWRARAALTVARRLVRDTFHDTRLKTSWWRRGGTLRLRGSVLCAPRHVSSTALCVYYAAAVERLLTLYGVEATVEVLSCVADGVASHCTMRCRRDGVHEHGS